MLRPLVTKQQPCFPCDRPREACMRMAVYESIERCYLHPVILPGSSRARYGAS